MFPFDKGKRVNTVGKQVEYWMNYIIPGVELNVKELNDLGISQLEVSQQFFDTVQFWIWNLLCAAYRTFGTSGGKTGYADH